MRHFLPCPRQSGIDFRRDVRRHPARFLLPLSTAFLDRSDGHGVLHGVCRKASCCEGSDEIPALLPNTAFDLATGQAAFPAAFPNMALHFFQCRAVLFRPKIRQRPCRTVGEAQKMEDLVDEEIPGGRFPQDMQPHMDLAVL